MRPSTAEAAIGDRVIFNCSTSLESSEIQWFHYPIKPNPERQLVYGYNEVAPNYRSKVRMEKTNNASFSIIIASVTVGDAGKYECQDDYGSGDKDSAQLIVLGTIKATSL